MKNTNGSTKSAQDCFNRGNTFYDQKDYQSAISEYNEAIRLSPDFVEAYNRRGFLKSQIGQHSEGISDCDTAIRLDPNNAVAYSIRGFLKSQMGQHFEGIPTVTRLSALPLTMQEPTTTEVSRKDD